MVKGADRKGDKDDNLKGMWEIIGGIFPLSSFSAENIMVGIDRTMVARARVFMMRYSGYWK